jgi:hypothetical protein
MKHVFLGIRCCSGSYDHIEAHMHSCASDVLDKKSLRNRHNQEIKRIICNGYRMRYRKSPDVAKDAKISERFTFQITLVIDFVDYELG